jgi:hypothetical protein
MFPLLSHLSLSQVLIFYCLIRISVSFPSEAAKPIKIFPKLA